VLVLDEPGSPARDENIDEDELDELCDVPENKLSIVLVISLLIACSS
jgi:hypothetical protein